MPAGASAAVSCALSSGTLTVDVNGGGTPVVAVKRVVSDIKVYSDFALTTEVACTNGPATTSNTTAIDVNDVDVSQATLFRIHLDGGPFISTAGAEGMGDDEIEISLDGGVDGSDNLSFKGTAGNDRWRLGDIGTGGQAVNLNLDEAADVGPPVQPDADDITMESVERLQAIDMQGGNDTLDARGDESPGSTEPQFTGPWDSGANTRQLVGEAGNDHIFAGAGDHWRIEGQAGDDEQIGGADDDDLHLAGGDDTADGNGGTADLCTYLNFDQNITVDLRIDTAQNTGGAGIDTITDCENLSGGDESDVLIGTDGDNEINGGENTMGVDDGGDTMIGLGGNDRIDGSFGIDEVSYAQGSSGGVSVSLATTAAQPTGGAGTDTLPDGNVADGLPDTENLIGSPFADNLTGNGQANGIGGLAGSDTINLAGGTDSFNVYDGVMDIVDCGTVGENDIGIADEVGVDSLIDCGVSPAVDFAPQTSVDAGPADGASTSETTPTYDLSADEAASFEYQIDGGSFTDCASAACTVETLLDGLHTLQFRAEDQDAPVQVDLNPVTRTLTVDTDPPDTGIAKRPRNRLTKRKARYRFTGDEAGVVFRCKIDRRGYRPCKARKLYRNLLEGRHRLLVRAVDLAGNVDPTPAKDRFRVIL